MKRKAVAMMLGMALAGSSMAAYAAESTTETSAGEAVSESSSDQSEQSEKISGQVREITEDSITLSLGTLEEGDPSSDTQNSGEQLEASADTDNADTPSAQDSISLVLTGKEEVYDYAESVTVTEEENQNFVAVISQKSDSQDAVSKEDETDALDDSHSTDVNSSEDKALSEADSLSDDDSDSADSLELAIDDIQVGDIVELNLNDAGEVEAIRVIYSEESSSDQPVSSENNETDVSGQSSSQEEESER